MVVTIGAEADVQLSRCTAPAFECHADWNQSGMEAAVAGRAICPGIDGRRTTPSWSPPAPSTSAPTTPTFDGLLRDIAG
ncbi:hypothetical protein [Streptomyces naphthomycinicus]|uniref:hypothetical protein n=1 Tax=Streptomyces naphthomycinicus TaxID=2872625 RepID=UPI001CEDA6E5|nr:hypothetical protein [Streptomyces sp. TML10]